MLCCIEVFLYVLVLHISRFSRLCSQTRFITKLKEIEVKCVYLNLGSDKVADFPGSRTTLGTDIKRSFLSKGKKKC